MASFEINFVSNCLMRPVTLRVILPADRLDVPGNRKNRKEPYKTLYLLHGIIGSHIDWCKGTDIEQLAEQYDLCVVMPSGENLFYLDYEPIHAYYGEYVGKEIVEFTRRVFPLSHKREDTFIAGLSMGGYGAMRNGLKYSDTFGYVAGLSAAAVHYTLPTDPREDGLFFETAGYAKAVFGEAEEVLNSDKSPAWLASQLIEAKKEVPKLFMTVGTEDDLLEVNRRLYKDLTDLGLEVTYEEHPGAHTWDFWNKHIKDVLKWLPL